MVPTMPSTAAVLAMLMVVVPAVLGQANTTYVDYSVEGQPNLDAHTMARIHFSFPDCDDGPLATTIVCDKSASAHDRAATLISMFTFEANVCAVSRT